MTFDVDYDLSECDPSVTVDATFGVRLHAWSEEGTVTLRFDSADEAERILDEWLHKVVMHKTHVPEDLFGDEVPEREGRQESLTELVAALEQSIREAKERRGA